MGKLVLYYHKRFEQRVHSYLLALKVLAEGSIDPDIFVCENLELSANDCLQVDEGSSGSSVGSSSMSSGSLSSSGGSSLGSSGPGDIPAFPVINIFPLRALVSIASAQDLATYLNVDVTPGLYRANEVALIFHTEGMMDRFFTEILADVRRNVRLQRLQISGFDIVDLTDDEADNLNFFMR